MFSSTTYRTDWKRIRGSVINQQYKFIYIQKNNVHIFVAFPLAVYEKNIFVPRSRLGRPESVSRAQKRFVESDGIWGREWRKTKIKCYDNTEKGLCGFQHERSLARPKRHWYNFYFFCKHPILNEGQFTLRSIFGAAGVILVYAYQSVTRSRTL